MIQTASLSRALLETLEENLGGFNGAVPAKDRWGAIHVLCKVLEKWDVPSNERSAIVDKLRRIAGRCRDDWGRSAEADRLEKIADTMRPTTN